MALLLNANDSVSRSYSITKPSPLHPIYPSGAGKRTGNLFDKSTNIVAYYLTQITGVYSATSSTSRSVLISCEPNTTYTVQVPTNRTLRIVEFDHYPQAGDAGSNYTSQETGSYIDKNVSITTTATAKYLCVFCYNSAQEATQYTESAYFSQVMLVSGSTAPSEYIPYGYQISITCGGTTTNIYLGSATSTRRVKKLVLTGEEDWTRATNGTFYGYFVTDYYNFDGYITICSHYIGDANRSSTATVIDKACCFRISDTKTIYIRDTSFNSATTFKQFLADQYAAGTPVTVWYVLATEETAAVNEPLMKIGDYADEVSVTGLPTIDGVTVYDCDLEVKPSKMYVKYRKHGT